VKATYQSP